VAALVVTRAEGVAVRFEWRLGGVALVLLVAILVRGWPRLLPLPVLLLGGMYGTQLVVDEAAIDTGAAAVAAGLLLTAELAYWSLDERVHVPAEAGDASRRVVYVALLGAGAVVVSLALLTLADAFRAQGLAIDLLGAVAAGVAVAGAWALARRGPQASR
jgi:hypothetical protein